MLRTTLVTISALCVLAATAARAAPAGSPTAAVAPAPATVYAISGRGWGHGVGMSQWGAYGFAQRGTAYDRILAHYYVGTELGRAPVGRVRVLLADGKTVLKVGSDAPFRVRDAAGAAHELAPGTYVLGAKLKLPVSGSDRPEPLPGPLTFSAGTLPLSLNGRRYRGTLELSVRGTKLRAVNAVGLEPYLYGVVPDEMPPHWPLEALKAQAVVARSYALAVRKTGDFDLYADVRSQVYGGVDSEEPQATAAVAATAGQVLLYQGRPATTYFFSTSGGRTASVADIWPSENAPPYLVSVPDPYDAASPHHRWGPVAVTPARLAKALGVRAPLDDVRTRLNASGRVAEVVAVAEGAEVAVPGATVRRVLELRSTWFRVGVLRLAPPERSVVPWGTQLSLAGSARGLAGAALEQRTGAGPWTVAAAVRPGGNGSFALRVRPLATGEYRLAAGSVRTPAVRVFVAPSVRLTAEPGILRGSVRPVIPGAAVSLQRQSEGGVWKPVAQAAVDASGAYEARLALAPGAYRARVAPGHGLVPGLSTVATVVAP